MKPWDSYGIGCIQLFRYSHLLGRHHPRLHVHVMNSSEGYCIYKPPWRSSLFASRPYLFASLMDEFIRHNQYDWVWLFANNIVSLFYRSTLKIGIEYSCLSFLGFAFSRQRESDLHFRCLSFSWKLFVMRQLRISTHLLASFLLGKQLVFSPCYHTVLWLMIRSWIFL